MSSVIGTAVRGALAGVVGTAAMTLVMRDPGERMIPRRYRMDGFPPRRVVQWMEDLIGSPRALTGSDEMRAAMVAHFLYGAGSGTGYALTRERLRTAPAPLVGMAYGLVIWAASYEGWMPALGVQQATSEKPPRRLPVYIGSHLIYGVTTALVYDALRPEEQSTVPDSGGARPHRRMAPGVPVVDEP